MKQAACRAVQPAREIQGPVQHLAGKLDADPLDREASGHAPHQAGHPDHEELVQIAREDSQEPDSLQQRDALVFGQLKHPLVEPEPAFLPVEVPVRGQRRKIAGHGAGLSGAHGRAAAGPGRAAGPAAALVGAGPGRGRPGWPFWPAFLVPAFPGWAFLVPELLVSAFFGFAFLDLARPLPAIGTGAMPSGASRLAVTGGISSRTSSAAAASRAMPTGLVSTPPKRRGSPSFMLPLSQACDPPRTPGYVTHRVRSVVTSRYGWRAVAPGFFAAAARRRHAAGRGTGGRAGQAASVDYRG